jgi:hypothetical protein
MPLADDRVTELTLWQTETPYKQPSDYIFASLPKRGKRPLWLSRIK